MVNFTISMTLADADYINLVKVAENEGIDVREKIREIVRAHIAKMKPARD